MASFESVVEEYDAGRPDYPAEVFEALGPLEGRRVLDVGAGTGIATRELLDRGGEVVAVDAGHKVLRRAVDRSPGLRAVVADGATLPVRTASIDLVCFAQAWHWLDADRRCVEVHRVLRDDGRWAGWWSQVRADGEGWFDEHWSVIEAALPGVHRSDRDTDWGAGLTVSGLFDVHDRVDVAWERPLTVDAWMTDQASHSYIASLPPARAEAVLGTLRSILERAWPDGRCDVRYVTSLWVADRR